MLTATDISAAGVEEASHTGAVMTRRSAGRLAGVMLVACGVVTALSPLLPTPAGVNRGAVLIIGVFATVVGVVALLLPWRRWHRAVAPVTLIPLALGLIALHNLYGGLDPYRYSVFYAVVFVWIGLTQPRGWSAGFAPLAALSYLLPLTTSPHPTWAYTSAVYALPVFVLVGESIAWMGHHLAEARCELAEQARTDPLTGLPNRVLVSQWTSAAAARAARRRADIGVVFLDLDGFKEVNDHFGHDFGDAVLIAVADRLRAAVRVGEKFVRIGGDEFACLAEDVGGAEGASHLARRLLDALQEPIVLGGEPVPITASLGVAVGRGPDVTALLRRADQAMYASKRAGGNTFVVAPPLPLVAEHHR